MSDKYLDSDGLGYFWGGISKKLRTGLYGGNIVQITFDEFYSGCSYTISDGKDTKFGTVPVSLIENVNAINNNSEYTITVTTSEGDKYNTKFQTGSYFTNIAVNVDYNLSDTPLRIYGVSRVLAEPFAVGWTRTDDGVGKTATASVGTTAGHSDFDKFYPWSKMKRETFLTGDVMVKIPEFWYERKVVGGIETIRIANKETEGFAKHPGSGKYVGAYKTSGNSFNMSVSGGDPSSHRSRYISRGDMRNYAKSKGVGWGLIDVATNSAIQMLYLVEYANNNSQAEIGRGYCYTSSHTFTGSCDNVPGLTGRPAGTDGETDVVYRGIEGIWGNVWEWMDGLNYNGDTNNYYVCIDQSKYADNTSTGYTKVSFTSPTEEGNNYIIQNGMDNAIPWAMLPSAVGSAEEGNAETSGYTDDFCKSTRWCDACRSGDYRLEAGCGIWLLYCRYRSSLVPDGTSCSRLLYDPSQS